MFDNQEDIRNWLIKHKVREYIIHDDLSVTALTDVEIYGDSIPYLPVQFRQAKRDFNIINCGLKSLSGTPERIGGSFNCNSNELTTLENGPKYVSSSYSCFSNQLKNLVGIGEVGCSIHASYNNIDSFDGVPAIVNGSLRLSYNNIISLKGAPQHINGVFEVSNNPLTSFAFLPTDIRNGVEALDTLITELHFEDLPDMPQPQGIHLSHQNLFRIHGLEEYYDAGKILAMKWNDFRVIVMKNVIEQQVAEIKKHKGIKHKI